MFTVAFNDSGTSDATYTATLTFNTADERSPGARGDSNLVVTLTATVSGGQNAVEALLAGPHAAPRRVPQPLPRLGDRALRSRARDRCHSRGGRAEGRQVRTLLRGEREPGPYQVTWDGHANDGRDLAGFYYLMLDAGGRRTARSVVKLR